MQLCDRYGNVIPVSLVDQDMPVDVINKSRSDLAIHACTWEPRDRDGGVIQVITDSLTVSGDYTVCADKYALGVSTHRRITHLSESEEAEFLKSTAVFFIVNPGLVNPMNCAIKESTKSGMVKVGLRRKVCFTIVMKDTYNNVAKVNKSIKEKTVVAFDDVNIKPELKLLADFLGLECWIIIQTHGTYTFKVRLPIACLQKLNLCKFPFVLLRVEVKDG